MRIVFISLFFAKCVCNSGFVGNGKTYCDGTIRDNNYFIIDKKNENLFKLFKECGVNFIEIENLGLQEQYPQMSQEDSNALPHSLPFMVYLIKSTQSIFSYTSRLDFQNSIACNAVLINRRFVLAAAHCITEQNDSYKYDMFFNRRFKVFLGFHDITLVKNLIANQSLYLNNNLIGISVENIIVVIILNVNFN